MTQPSFETTHRIHFGDCDPAGILFYPNHFRLMDATFHAWLATRGLDQAGLRARLGAMGTGLLDAAAIFRAPVAPGCALRHELRVEGWERRTLRLAYRGLKGDRLVIEGRETRGLFLPDPSREGGITLAEIAPLRALIDV